jgi:hypothetical protein
MAAGSYLFCRRDAFEAVGGFDQSLYASEEIRFSRRLKQWGRVRNLRFCILSAWPVATSARKLEWYSTGEMLRTLALMLFFPLVVRSRRLCRFWYERPQPAPTPAPKPSEQEDRA